MLTEKTVLSSVEIKPETNSVNVRWDNRIEKDGEVISSIPHRKAYTQDMKAEFLDEVEGAEAYVAAIGWQ